MVRSSQVAVGTCRGRFVIEPPLKDILMKKNFFQALVDLLLLDVGGCQMMVVV